MYIPNKMMNYINNIFIFVKKDTSTVLIGTAISNVVRLISTIILTRILDPSAYGVVGILSSIGFTVVMLTDVGIFSYVIRHQHATDSTFLDRVWTLRLIRCLFLMALVILIAPVLAWALEKPITLAIIAYSLTFGAEAISSMAFATAVRERQLARLAVLDALPQLLILPFTILLALWLHSYWALIIAMIFATLLNAMLSYALFPHAKRKLRYSRETARDLWSFGRSVSAASIIHLVLSQADKIVLGRILSLSSFGLYNISSTISGSVKIFNSSYSQRILYPCFVEFKDRESYEVSDIFYSVGKHTRIIYGFFSGLILFCSELIITILYDERFFGASSFLFILLIGNIFSLSISAATQLLLALGHTTHIFRMNLARLCFFIVFGGLGLYLFGSKGLVAAVSGTDIIAQRYCWVALSRVGIFSVRKETPFWLAALVGCGIGWFINKTGIVLIS